MSLGVAIKGPEGVVLAADCRVTIGAQAPNRPQIMVHYDNATKLLNFSEPHNFVGAVTYGLGLIGQRTAHSYLPEFESRFPSSGFRSVTSHSGLVIFSWHVGKNQARRRTILGQG